MPATHSLSGGTGGRGTVGIVGVDLVGTVLSGRYTLESKIGDGAMGTVDRARHARIPRSFAVKVLHKHLVANPKLMTRFYREAELAGRLEHGNLVAVVDVGEAEGVNYLVMELAEGRALVDLLPEAPFSAERFIPLVRQLCDGLHYAHELGLIHRDFKPENVMITRDDHGREIPRIVDFGIAILRDQAATQEDRLTTAGLVLGTPHYMAPEQAMGAAMDPRVDLFALGVICYELLSGAMPFDGSGVEVARANLLTPTPAMSARAAGVVVDPLLEAFTRRLLAKDKAQRPATARAARDLLDLIESDRRAAAAALGVLLPAVEQDHVRRAQPVSQPPPVITAATDRLPRANRRGLAIAGVVAAAVFATVMIIATRDTSTGPIPAVDASVPTDDLVSDRAVAHESPAPPSHASAIDAGVFARPAPVIARIAPPPPIDAGEPARDPATAPIQLSSPPSARAVAELYVVVGGELKAYSDSHGHDVVADLWSRYRRIILNDVMATPARRQSVTELLQQIRRDLAAR
jgi:serine/threonine-protein kinase